MEQPKENIKEQRIREITHLYYSRPEIQKAIFSFSQNREVVPRYFETFGKRPDVFQYPGDIFELVKNGATSFHCSEELWRDALKLSTDMKEKELADLRIGWDLLIDIDSKYIDYSKISAELTIKILKFHGIKNFGIKFSGSKGFHILIPWKAFPSRVNEIKTSEMFPEWPRIIVQYLNEQIKEQLIEKIRDTLEEAKFGFLKKYIRRDEGEVLNLLKSPKKYSVEIGEKGKISEDNLKYLESEKEKSDFIKKVMPDLTLVSPRHLFRMPYSLHEKTALASVVLSPEQIKDFQPKDANPLKIKIREFIPESKENEAQELLIQALDWHREKIGKEEKRNFKEAGFKPLKIKIFNGNIFPPSIKKILQGVKEGRKRSVFILINFFRSIGMEKDELEKRIYEWNNKNEMPLKQGYIKSQLSWSYRNKIVPPPNYDKDYYKGIGIIPTEEEMKYKNPVNYMSKKILNRENKTQRDKNNPS